MTVRATAANPAILRWAREGLGLTTGQVAEKMRRPIEVIEAWEAGVESPTFNQLERLADVVYKRPVAVFFFPEPPEDEDLQTEFRTLPGREFDKLERDTRLALREARGYQISLAELAGGTNPRPRLITRDLRASLDDPLLDLVSRVRAYLGVSLEEQESWRDPTDAFKNWRETVEGAGVFVFKRAFEQREISGFCLRGPEFPIILINNSTPHTRQIFTLFHELAHLLFGVSGITTSDPRFEDVFTGRSREIEVRCNRFAAEFLVPRRSFPWDLLDALSLDEAVSRIADRFNVSREVILRRLLEEGRIARTTYEQKARKWIDQAQEARRRGSSGGNYYANQATYLGDAFLELGFSQYHAGHVTLSELADHFGMRAPIVSRLESYILSRR